jgi:membrane-associated phospholipid phosphatase
MYLPSARGISMREDSNQRSESEPRGRNRAPANVPAMSRLRTLLGRRPTARDRVFEAATWPGDKPQSRIVPALVIAAIYALRGRRSAAWQAVAIGAMPIGWVLKRIVRRPRPPSSYVRIHGERDRQSFPSTHAALYTSFFGHAALALASRGGFSRALALVPLGLVVLVGPARIREGEHWRTDVIAGYLLGATYLAAVAAAERQAGGAAVRSVTRGLTRGASRKRGFADARSVPFDSRMAHS